MTQWTPAAVLGARPAGMITSMAGLEIDRVRFLEGEIRFDSYPFVGASVQPSGSVPANRIASVDTHAAPPEVHTNDGETLLVSALRARELGAFAERHAIPDVQRRDVWHLILDVYFEPPPGPENGTLLLECGLAPPQVDAIRARVAPFMRPYVACTWFDWPHLGLYDLLDAYITCSPRSPSSEEVRETYWWAMGIAGRGDVRPPVW